MKKINLEVTCKRDRFGYWNSCKRLPNFVNVAALLIGKKIFIILCSKILFILLFGIEIFLVCGFTSQ